ncbi:MAG: hypothetical protein U9P10_00750 [Thermodesulfobacteriota bacterium]|nr:hypothetical protein [Thermodesulfobacteriota bacterium]
MNHPGNTFGPDNHPENSQNNPGLNSPLNIFNVKGIKSGLIMVDKIFFYMSDILDVSIVFPKSLTAVWNGSADTYLVIRIPEETQQADEIAETEQVEESEETEQTKENDSFILAPFLIRTSGEIPDTPKTFVSLDLSQTTLPVGAYQIAMILVKPEGDPLKFRAPDTTNLIYCFN